MAYRLGQYVVFGELYNNKSYTTHGVIVLRGTAPGKETALHLSLTGDCDAALKGKVFRFRPDEAGDAEGPVPPKVFRPEDHPGLQMQQVGATGTMTAQGWVKTFRCSVAEFLRRSRLGEPPPTEWKRRLYLEWYSQNGRVVIELAGPVVEQCTRIGKGFEDEGEWAPLANLVPPPDDSPPAPGSGPSFTLIRRDDDGTVSEERFTADDLPDELKPAAPTDAVAGSDLQRQLDAQAAAVERALRGDRGEGEEAEDSLAETKLMDWCLDHAEDKPLEALLGELAVLPPPEQFDDGQIETQLKLIVGRMALFGVALDVCEHFSPRDCYVLLRDKLMHEASAYAELAGTGWVQHISTWEYCPRCEAEIEQRLTKNDAKGNTPPSF